jgi:AmiR/NasT family two-component response regulator
VESRQKLRVLVANHRPDRVEVIAAAVGRLGHDVVAREIHVSEVAAVSGRVRPDVALVGNGDDPAHALKLIGELVRGAFCPVIAVLDAYDAEWIDEAAKRGVYAYIVDTRPEEVQSAIDIALRRFSEFQGLQGAFDRNNGQLRREAELLSARRRQLLELQDGVVQQLAVVHLALELNHVEKARDATLDVLENAQGIISRSIEELRSEGIPLEELIADAAPA